MPTRGEEAGAAGFVLVDTSVWIAYFSTAPARVERRLEALLAERRAAIAPPVRFEYLPHVRREGERRRLEAFFAGLPFLGEAQGFWDRCEADQRRLVEKGVAGVGFLDLLLCDIARSHRAAIYSLDSHFEEITAVLAVRVLS